MMQQSHDERRMNMNTQLPEKVNTFFENCKKNNFVKILKNVLEMYISLVYNEHDWLIKL